MKQRSQSRIRTCDIATFITSRVQELMDRSVFRMWSPLSHYAIPDYIVPYSLTLLFRNRPAYLQIRVFQGYRLFCCGRQTRTANLRLWALCVTITLIRHFEPPAGLEPATIWLQIRSSTNWAKGAWRLFLQLLDFCMKWISVSINTFNKRICVHRIWTSWISTNWIFRWSWGFVWARSQSNQCGDK